MKELTPAMKKFVLHWGEMGTRWGINRTVAQIHALLYLSPKPLNAEEIAETLSVARSNVSTSLKELQGWGIVRIVHVMGDRRDHYESMKDVWEMFQIILNERKRREIDPTLVLLKECMAEAEKGGASEEFVKSRLKNLEEFFQTTMGWYQEVSRMPMPFLVRFMKMGGKIKKLLGFES